MYRLHSLAQNILTCPENISWKRNQSTQLSTHKNLTKNNKHPYLILPSIEITSPPLVSSNHTPLRADSSFREISTRLHIHCYRLYEKFAQ